jgi:malto-oligosyltrehalose trehalohydrolase/4-alpha-glucanotransferase
MRGRAELSWLERAEAAGSGSGALAALEREFLPRYLMGCRWYASKEGGPPEVRILDLIPFGPENGGALLAILAATPPGRPEQRYFLPLAFVPEGGDGSPPAIAEVVLDGRGGAVVDALCDDAFVWELVRTMREAVPGTGEPRPGIKAWSSAALASMPADPSGDAVARGKAEQSNTSMRIGRWGMLKAFRQLQAGIHPEVEVSGFLSGTARFRNTPRFLAGLEWSSEDPPSALCVLQELVPDARDAWEHVLEGLSGRLKGTAPGEPLADEALLNLARMLGRRTAEMHRAFAADTDDPAFRAEPVEAADLRGWADAARAMALDSLGALERAVPRLDPAMAKRAEALLARRDEILSRLDASLPAGAGMLRTRLHGDFHLGQVLVSGEDVFIIDFEGEPMRPLEQRRAKQSPLRDVAGMLRSFAYAAAAAGRDDAGRVVTAGGRSGDMADWADAMSREFLRAYEDRLRGGPGFPDDPAVMAGLLRLFLLEKAFYEIGYELANRPGWVDIPLEGVMSILDGRDSLPGTGAGPGTSDMHEMPFGAAVLPDGKVRFGLWAPGASAVMLRLEDDGLTLPMTAQAEGWHEIVTDRAGPGSRYRFEMPDGLTVPDPASRYQPDDVHGPSEVVDPRAYRWSDGDWKGRPWHETVLYELHVGTFTPEGTFRAVIDRLDHLVDLGVTAIELLPLADFPGRRNWGYDGVLLYAPDSVYGRPEDLKALVDAAHARGLMVFIDVVYNHFGPDGNYFGAYAPQLFTDRHKTPWGSAINYDGAGSGPVRDFMIHNTMYWIEEFHFDGLRFDAVHAIIDDTPRHFLEELAERVRERFGSDRHVHLVLENDANQARFLERDGEGAPRWFDAQWDDDLHHCLHVAASGEDAGYYEAYAGRVDLWGRALAEGFSYQGEVSPFSGEARGEPSSHLPPTAFVGFIQNHDQVGNRAFGDRITSFAETPAVRAAASLYLLAPSIPMLFMGEEWAAAQPFPFFCDFGPELSEAVRNGRREEFAKFPEFQDPEKRDHIPDPTGEATFASAKLAWEDTAKEPHAGWLDWYRRALAVRRAEIVPRLPGIPGGAGEYETFGGRGLRVRWRLGDGSLLTVTANLGPGALDEADTPRGRVIWSDGAAASGGGLGPWQVVWTIEEGSALDRLADRMGVRASYGSAAGGTVEISSEVKRDLLGAMGIDAADEEAAGARLAELERALFDRILPPVVVVREDHFPLRMPVALPAGTGTVEWTLVEEGGRTCRGEAGFGGLELADRARFDGRLMEIRRLEIPGTLQLGYHRLSVAAGNLSAETTVIATPLRCHLPAELEQGRRLWGIAAQLYTLRSERDWGIGDFGDLWKLIGLAASRGAAVLGLNPLHALFLDRPEHASPYSPASRLFLNVLYIDPGAIPEAAGSDEARAIMESKDFRRRLEACREGRLVDYPAVAALKLPVLEILFREFQDKAGQGRRGEFAAFREEQGKALRHFCVFQALREHFGLEDPASADWRRWPPEYRDPDGPAVARFAQENRDRVDFLAWLQWVADTQLATAARTARASGMSIGLYRDLAVGADSSGAETWAKAGTVAAGASVGAPPDIFNPAGQDWGLPPFNPHALREEAYAGFIELLRANMRHAGGLRIDHVMALQHLYWIPAGRTAAEGGYVGYPLEDMVGILALESRRNLCLVVGEDLGTVPEGFRERMAEAAVLSYRVVFFEWEEDGSFSGPGKYPYLSLAVAGSHDMATLRGWWEGSDIELKSTKGLYPDEAEAGNQRRRRAEDRSHLVEALRAAATPLPASFGADAPWSEALENAVNTFLARTSAAIAIAQLDDLTGEREQVNLPGSVDEYPNWRRRLSLTLEQLAEDAEACAAMAILSARSPAAGPDIQDQNHAR